MPVIWCLLISSLARTSCLTGFWLNPNYNPCKIKFSSSLPPPPPPPPFSVHRPPQEKLQRRFLCVNHRVRLTIGDIIIHRSHGGFKQTEFFIDLTAGHLKWNPSMCFVALKQTAEREEDPPPPPPPHTHTHTHTRALSPLTKQDSKGVFDSKSCYCVSSTGLRTVLSARRSD